MLDIKTSISTFVSYIVEQILTHPNKLSALDNIKIAVIRDKLELLLEENYYTLDYTGLNVNVPSNESEKYMAKYGYSKLIEFKETAFPDDYKLFFDQFKEIDFKAYEPLLH